MDGYDGNDHGEKRKNQKQQKDARGNAGIKDVEDDLFKIGVIEWKTKTSRQRYLEKNCQGGQSPSRTVQPVK